MRSLFKSTLASVVILLLAVSCTNDRSTQDKDLPRSTPEAEGVKSDGIIAFLKATEKEKHDKITIDIKHSYIPSVDLPDLEGQTDS